MFIWPRTDSIEKERREEINLNSAENELGPLVAVPWGPQPMKSQIQRGTDAELGGRTHTLSLSFSLSVHLFIYFICICSLVRVLSPSLRSLCLAPLQVCIPGFRLSQSNLMEWVDIYSKSGISFFTLQDFFGVLRSAV